MEHDEFAAALIEMGYTRERWAQLLDVKSTTTVENWAVGAIKVPGPIATIVEYLLERPEARAWFEARRPPGTGTTRPDKRRRRAESRETRSTAYKPRARMS